MAGAAIDLIVTGAPLDPEVIVAVAVEDVGAVAAPEVLDSRTPVCLGGQVRAVVEAIAAGLAVEGQPVDEGRRAPHAPVSLWA